MCVFLVLSFSVLLLLRFIFSTLMEETVAYKTFSELTFANRAVLQVLRVWDKKTMVMLTFREQKKIEFTKASSIKVFLRFGASIMFYWLL